MVAACLCPLGTVVAQEALRMSLASEQAAQARRQAISEIGYYNLRLGPTAWTFTSGVGVGYVDNVAYLTASRGSGGDLFFQPRVTTRMRWPVTEKNSLDFSLDAGYLAYVQHSDLDRFFISPGSELSFDVVVGNLLINFHDRPSIMESTYQDPTVSSGDYTRFENDLGFVANWDMNKVLLRLGYDHVNYLSLGGSSTYPDGQSDLIFLSGAYSPKPARYIGLETGLGLIEYEQQNLAVTNVFSGGTQLSAGAFYTDRLTDYIQFRVNAGYTVFQADTTFLAPGESDTASPYLAVSIVHRIHERVSHSLTGGRVVNLGFLGGNYQVDSIRWQADWRVIHKVNVTTPVYYERWSRVSTVSRFADEFDRVGAGITLSRSLTQKLGSSFSYQFILKDSERPGESYTVNTLTLSFSYRF